MSPSIESKRSASLAARSAAVLFTALVAGTLDLLAAFVLQGHLIGDTPPGRVLQFIASRAFGNAAYTGGAAMAYWGLALHYLFALLFTTAYFLWYPSVSFFSRHCFMESFLRYSIRHGKCLY